MALHEDMPYVDGILVDLLRPYLAGQYAGQTVPTVGTSVPSDYLQRMPYVAARSIGGDVADERFDASRALIQIDAYAADRRAGDRLAWHCRSALINGWQARVPTEFGALIDVVTISTPFEIRDLRDPDRQYRWVATYTVAAIGPTSVPSV